MGERKRASKIEWQVIRLRARCEYLGTVSAPDEDAALKAAIKLFCAAGGRGQAPAAAPISVMPPVSAALVGRRLGP